MQKKYHDVTPNPVDNDNQLLRRAIILALIDHFDIFKVGKQPLAVDLEKENTMDRISIDDFSANDINGQLTTNIPGFSILVRSGLKKDIQDNSTFEITKVEKLEDS